MTDTLQKYCEYKIEKLVRFEFSNFIFCDVTTHDVTKWAFCSSAVLIQNINNFKVAEHSFQEPMPNSP